MKYFAIFDKNATIFQLQWNVANIHNIFLQYSVLCGFDILKYEFKLQKYSLYIRNNRSEHGDEVKSWSKDAKRCEITRFSGLSN